MVGIVVVILRTLNYLTLEVIFGVVVIVEGLLSYYLEHTFRGIVVDFFS